MRSVTASSWSSFTGRGTAIAKKIADEFRAGLRLTDVHTGGSGPIIFGLAGMLEPVEAQFILPEVRDAEKLVGRPYVRG